MRATRVLSVVALALCLTASGSWAVTVADYTGDFVPGAFNGQTRPAALADGWDYMWNANAAIGTAAGNYSSLKAWGTAYNFDGAGGLPRANPAAYDYLHSTGGHPGRGSSQGAGFDRYAIGAYEIQPGEAGFLQIANSSVSVTSGNSGGVETRVYVNDTLRTSFVAAGAAGPNHFDMALGPVSVGDKVYVAVGPNVHDGFDTFGLGYRLETTTDASTVLWDANGSLPVDGGTGNWDTANARWYSAAGSYTTWNNGAALNANFGPAAGTVTLTEPITARSLTFGAGGYTIDGASTLTLTGAGTSGPGPATLNVVSQDPTTIAAAIASSAHVNKIGPGTLILTGNNTLGAELRAAGGELILAGSSVTNVSTVAKVGVTSHWAPGGTSGTLTIQDNAQLTARHIYMGENWDPTISGMKCVINQTGGTVTTTAGDGENNGIRIGHWPSETSTYNLSGGTLTIGGGAELGIAIDGTGIYNQTGGVMNATTVVVNCRNNANGNGTFTVAGGVANIGAGGIVNEGTGPAAVNVGGSGGTLRATASWASSLDMALSGTGRDNSPRFDTNGHNIALSGSLSGAAAELQKIGDGTLTLTGATNTLNAIDASGGNLVLGGSSITTASNLVRVGTSDNWVAGGGSGTLTIQDNASLTTGRIYMGENWTPKIPGMTATIDQTGGTVTITGTTGENAAIRIGHWSQETSTYNLSGGALSITDPNNDLAIGTDGTGIFHQTGGQATVPGIQVNHRNAGGSGTLIVEGTGVMNIGGRGLKVAAGAATLGGSSVTTVTGNVSVGDWNFGGGPSTLTIQDNAVLNANGTEFMVGDSNSVPGAVNQTGGTVNIAGRTRIAHWPNNTSVYTLSGTGVLNANGAFNVGWDGTGQFVQNGGASHFNSSLIINAHNGPGATFTLNDGIADASYIGIGRWSGRTGTLNVNGGTLTVSNDLGVGEASGSTGQVNHTDGDVTVDRLCRIGHWSNNTSTYTMSGGTLTLSGTGAVITAHGERAGVLYLGIDGTGVYTQTGGQADAYGIHLDHRGNTGGTDTFTLEGGTFTVGPYGIASSNPTIAVNLGGGTIRASANFSFFSGSTIHPVTLTGTGGDATIDTNGHVVELWANLSGPGGYRKTGGSDLGLRGTNSHSGVTVIEQGRAIVYNNNSLSPASDLTVNGDLDLWNYSPTAKSLSGTGRVFANNGLQILTVGANDGSGTFSGVLQDHTWNGAARMGLTKIGAGAQTLIGDQTYTGPTTVSGGVLAVNNARLYTNFGWQNQVITVNNGGTLELGGWADGDAQGLGRVSFNPANLVLNNGTVRYTDTATTGRADRGFTIGAGGATLDASGGNTFSILDLGRPFPIISSSGGLLTLTGPGDGLITKAIPGTGGVVKTGTGTWTIGGTNTYTGPTTVAGGTLRLDGSHTGGGAYSVFSGATLTGSGSTASPVTVQGGGILMPDGGLGTGSLTLEAASIFDIGIDGLSVFDYLDVTGTVAIQQALLQVAMGYMPTIGDEFIIINNDGTADPVAGIFAGLPEGGYVIRGIGGGPNDLQISYVGGDGNDVALTTVPEPTTLSLLGLGALAAFLRRRRRK